MSNGDFIPKTKIHWHKPPSARPDIEPWNSLRNTYESEYHRRETGVLVWFEFADDDKATTFAMNISNGWSGFHIHSWEENPVQVSVSSLVDRDKIVSYVQSDVRGSAELAVETQHVTVVDHVELFCRDVDGIGRTIAQRLAREFGSIRSVQSASREEFASITGVGSAKARRLVEHMHEKETDCPQYCFTCSSGGSG